MTKSFILALVLLFPFSGMASYYFSIGKNDEVNTTVIVSGGGENYGLKSVEEIISQNLHATDEALKAFTRIIDLYKNGSSNRKKIDSLALIQASTSLSDIFIDITMFDGRYAIIMLAVKHEDNSLRRSVVFLEFNGSEWAFVSNLTNTISDGLIALGTVYVSCGKQISKETFDSYIKNLSELDGKINFPILVKLTNGSGINSHAFFSKTISGDMYEKITETFDSMFSAYKLKDNNFVSYWDKEDANEIRKIIDAKGAYMSLASEDLNGLEQCSNGYSFLGISNIDNDITVLFVQPKDENHAIAFFLKGRDDDYKFTRYAMLGRLGTYISSFFNSPEVLNQVKNFRDFKTSSEQLFQ